MKKAILSAAIAGAAITLSAGGYNGPSFGELDKKASKGGSLTVVFFGGSLTWGANSTNPQMKSLRAIVGDYLVKRYPKAGVTLIDAAIGGTGSELGLFRLERDVLAYKPDLVFLDRTVNDGLYQSTLDPLYTHETEIRELLKRGIPTVQVIFGDKKTFSGKEPEKNKIPRRVQHLKINKYYNLCLGDTYQTMYRGLRDGSMSLDKAYLPNDGCHPNDPGYAIFAKGVIEGYEAAVKANLKHTLPEKPLYGAYAKYTRLDAASIKLPKGWELVQTQRTGLWFDGQASRWMDMLVAGGPDAQPLKIKTYGNLLGFFGEGNPDSLAFKVKVDGKELPKAYDPSTRKFGTGIKGNLFYWISLGNKFTNKAHDVEIIPVANADFPKGKTKIGAVCFAGDLIKGSAK